MPCIHPHRKGFLQCVYSYSVFHAFIFLSAGEKIHCSRSNRSNQWRHAWLWRVVRAAWMMVVMKRVSGDGIWIGLWSHPADWLHARTHIHSVALTHTHTQTIKLKLVNTWRLSFENVYLHAVSFALHECWDTSQEILEKQCGLLTLISHWLVWLASKWFSS